MSNEIRYERATDYVEKKVGDELILVPLCNQVAQMSEVFTLNEVGACIWETLTKPKTMNDIVQQITEQFEVAADIAQTDIQAFINQAVAKNMIKELKS
jgi:hypothetical protein